MLIPNGLNYEKWRNFWNCKGWSYCDKELRTQTMRTGITPSGQMRERTALTKKKMIVWRIHHLRTGILFLTQI
jgi:hypothetical protein